MRLGGGVLEDDSAKCIRDKHNKVISMAASERQPPPSPSHKPIRSGEINHRTHLHVKGREGWLIKHKSSLRASSPIWVSEASRARTCERAVKLRGAEERRACNDLS